MRCWLWWRMWHVTQLVDTVVVVLQSLWMQVATYTCSWCTLGQQLTHSTTCRIKLNTAAHFKWVTHKWHLWPCLLPAGSACFGVEWVNLSSLSFPLLIAVLSGIQHLFMHSIPQSSQLLPPSDTVLCHTRSLHQPRRSKVKQGQRWWDHCEINSLGCGPPA